MLDREPLTTTITGRRDVLRHQPISEAKITPEFLLRQLRAIKAVRYSAKPHRIPCCPMEAVPLLTTCKFLLSSQLRHLNILPLFPRAHTCPAYALPIAYVV